MLSFAATLRMYIGKETILHISLSPEKSKAFKFWWYKSTRPLSKHIATLSTLYFYNYHCILVYNKMKLQALFKRILRMAVDLRHA